MGDTINFTILKLAVNHRIRQVQGAGWRDKVWERDVVPFCSLVGIFDADGGVDCLCSKEHIHQMFWVEHEFEGKVTRIGPIGSVCIKKRFGYGEAMSWIEKGYSNRLNARDGKMSFADAFMKNRRRLEQMAAGYTGSKKEEKAGGWYRKFKEGITALSMEFEY
jgi:hypothetical protein